FDGLSEPLYWYDEAITSLRVAGHTEQEVAAFATAHPVMNLGDLQPFLNVDSSTSTGDTVRSLSSEDAQHTPAFYVLARWWSRLCGSSLDGARAFSALNSLLAMAALYWVCLELFIRTGAFQSRIVCWLALVAFAFSPYQIAYAREFREYSMWALTTLIV